MIPALGTYMKRIQRKPIFRTTKQHNKQQHKVLSRVGLETKTLGALESGMATRLYVKSMNNCFETTYINVFLQYIR